MFPDAPFYRTPVSFRAGFGNDSVVTGPKRMFTRQRRNPVIRLGVVVVLAVALAVTGLILAQRGSRFTLTGTFWMARPEACPAAASADVTRTPLVFQDQDGRVLGRANASRGVRLRTVTVRGYVHCEEWATYQVRLLKPDELSVVVPSLQRRLGPVTFDALEAHGLRYDLRV